MSSTLDLWLGRARNGLGLTRPSEVLQAEAPQTEASASAHETRYEGGVGHGRAEPDGEEEDHQFAVSQQLLGSQSCPPQNEDRIDRSRLPGSPVIPSRPMSSFVASGQSTSQAQTYVKVKMPPSHPRPLQSQIKHYRLSLEPKQLGTPKQNTAAKTYMKAAARFYGDELDTHPLPLVTSDLDTRYPGQSTNSGPAQRDPVGTPLSVSKFTSPQKSSDSNGGTAPASLLVVGIPTTPKAPALPLTTTGRSPITVSIPPLSAERLREMPEPSSPVVAVGRRTNTVNNDNFRIRGGRPKGWKPGMSYREVALRNLGVDGNATSTVLLTPPKKKKSKDLAERAPRHRRIAGSHKPNYVLKRKGRPPLLSIETVQRAIFLNSKAIFRPFLCEWAGCRAELQNMATLRKHVTVVHGRAAKCCWRKCASRTMPPGAGGMTVGTGEVKSEGEDEDEVKGEGESLMEHIEYHHLAPAEWHQGDGFANSGSLGPPALGVRLAPLALARDGARAKDGGSGHLATVHLPRYLLDDEGNQVTPLLQDPLLEPAALSRSRAETMRRLQDAYRQIQRQRGL